MSKWFAANRLALNLDKTNIIKFIANNSPQHTLNIVYSGKCIEESVNTKFIGFQIHNLLNWTNHIDKLIPKLGGECYTVRSVCHIINTDTQISLFGLFSLWSEVWNNFFGNSSNSKKVFTLQKKIVTLMAGVKP
jgi:hypothetical protein